MKETETVNLINGTFSPEEAQELLLELLRSKINFHNIRNWSSKERLGEPDTTSEQKLIYLEEARRNLQMLLAEAIIQQNSVTIIATIELKIED